MSEGVRARHSRTCRSREGGRCNCKPSWEAWVWHPRERKKERQSFTAEAAAKGWRRQALIEIDQGRRRAPTKLTLREAAEAWLTDAQTGLVLAKAGTRYKPSVLRSYETSLKRHVLHDLGGAKLSAIGEADLEALVTRLQARGLSPSTIRNAIMPLRAIYRRHRREVPVNPTRGLELPAVVGKRDRIADPIEAAALVAAAPAEHRALWATAFYTGLRLGELRALRWPEVDLAGGVIRVEWSWDAKAGRIAPKSEAALRAVPVAVVLREVLVEHRMRAGDSDGFVFGKTDDTPFAPATVDQRTKRAWKVAGLRPITLHEARHTFASLMIAAGVNAKALSTYMGHSSVTITYDRYGHLMPGNEREAARLLDAYLVAASESAEEKARAADLGPDLSLSGAHSGAQDADLLRA